MYGIFPPKVVIFPTLPLFIGLIKKFLGPMITAPSSSLKFFFFGTPYSMYGNTALTFSCGSLAGLNALSCPAFKCPSFVKDLIAYNAFIWNGFPIETYDGLPNKIESV